MPEPTSSRRLPWLLAILFLLVPTALLAQDDKKDKKPKPIPHTVVKIGEEVKILRKADVKAEKTRLDREYKQAVKAHREAAAAARKAKQKFTDPKPKKSKWKVLANCKSEEAANEYVAKIEEKERKKERKRKRSKSGSGK